MMPTSSRSFVRRRPLAALAPAFVLVAGCAQPRMAIHELRGDLRVDGNLDEPCYRLAEALADFHVACEPRKTAPPTRAWVFWEPRKLVFAFECRDGAIIAAPETGDE